VPLSGESIISPVVFPPIVRVLKSVVWIDLGAPARVRLPDTDAKPVVVRFVNVAAAGVVAPITVLLIPVAVTLKFPAVNNTLFAPKSRLEAERPVKFNAPEVPVMLTAPVEIVRPADPVRRPAEVIVPVPVVRMFPDVVAFPLSSIVSFVIPPDLISRAIPYVGAVSSIINALAVPAFVSANEVATPRPEARVKSILRPEVVRIVLPPLYADCRVEADAGHLMTLSEASRQRDEEEDTGVVRPKKVTNESASVLKVTSFVPAGSKLAAPLAVNVSPDVTIAPAEKVENPFAFKRPPSVVVPVPTVKVLVPVTLVAPLRETAPVPVEKVEAPVWDTLLLNVETPVTVSAPPRVVRPVPTEKVLVPVTLVAPLRETAPVPVENIPAPS